MTGFRSHLKSRQRAGDMTKEDASLATPVEVKVLDRYLTVASANSHRYGEATPAALSAGQPSRLCSLRVILLLEDMGATGDPDDEVRSVVCEYNMFAAVARMQSSASSLTCQARSATKLGPERRGRKWWKMLICHF